MKIKKIGNTTLKFNTSRAAKTEEEIQAILDEASEVVSRSLIDAAIKKQQEMYRSSVSNEKL